MLWQINGEKIYEYSSSNNCLSETEPLQMTKLPSKKLTQEILTFINSIRTQYGYPDLILKGISKNEN